MVPLLKLNSGKPSKLSINGIDSWEPGFRYWIISHFEGVAYGFCSVGLAFSGNPASGLFKENMHDYLKPALFRLKPSD